MRRVLVMVMVLLIAGACAAPGPIRAPDTKPPQTAAAVWYPSDFHPTPQDPLIAYRWLKGLELTCSYSSGSCWGMYLIPKDGCSSLYVELSIQDSSGTVVDSSASVLSGVAAGQRAKMVFDTFDEAADTARIASITCV